MIISTAPSRISLFGGGTDLPEFADKYGGRVLSMAINLHHVCTVVSKDGLTRMEAMGEYRDLTNVPPRHTDSKFDLMYEILRSYVDVPPILIQDIFEGIQSSGLGSSASAAVAFIGAMDRLKKIKRSKMEVAKRAYQAEVALGWISGKQDQYASALGGMNLIEFENGDVWVDEIPKSIATAFEEWCVLLHSGKTRHSSDIQAGLKQNILNSKGIESLLKLRGQTWVARDLLVSGDFHGVGKLLREAWDWKKKSNPSATNEHIDAIFTQAYKSGAIGGKVLGAGGEGCILFVVDPKKREWFINEMGLKYLDFSINFNGLTVREF